MLELLKKVGILFFETIKIIVVSLAIILPIRYFLIQPFYVEGASMEPSFHPNEYLIIDEISYRLSDPKRGDVVVFRYPRDPKQFYIKRMIGLPGETIRIVNGNVFVNDAKLAEEYLSDLYLSKDTKEELTLGQNEYYLLGDNRANSLDSRVFGPVTDNHLIGRVWIRGWPLNRLDVFGEFDY
jgi:signal peptidase I